MTTFNLTSYENSRIIKTIKAESQSKAKEILENKGYDCNDDYFLESQDETDKHNKLSGRTIYIDDDGDK